MNETDSTLKDHPTASDVGKDFSDSIGARLHALRKKFGLSQRELARRANVTNSTLSMIEQGKVSPSVGSLEKILYAFPISLQEFFSEPAESSPTVIQADEFVIVNQSQVEIRMLPLSMGSRRDGILLAEQSYQPGARINSDWLAHNGFVGGILIVGSIELHLDGIRYQLNSGDGFNFCLNRDHTLINNGEGVCKVVCAITNR
ncbi:helix-turn-helix domain-containing protein [Agarilytica rhodophyticola]|uniref:helix-turn-helix domain-containing protein n=1 Tax=Agarilytica rhodophyticola TaxID=1737490 RepID=UPI000B343EC5|nr:helix-turn-helix domain-containing protein [Agarilytica rhodophyticola]